MTDRRQASVLERILEVDREDLHTGLPGRVRSYDSAAQTVDVVLEIRRVRRAAEDEDEDDVSDYPILPAVPVCFPRGGGFSITWPLEPGDKVFVVFAEADLSRWRETGDTSDPGVASRHALSGAVAHAGVHTRRDVPPGEAGTLRIGRESGSAVIRVTGAAIEAGGNSALALATQTQNQLDALVLAVKAVNTAIPAGASNDAAITALESAIEANALGTQVLKGS